MLTPKLFTHFPEHMVSFPPLGLPARGLEFLRSFRARLFSHPPPRLLFRGKSQAPSTPPHILPRNITSVFSSVAVAGDDPQGVRKGRLVRIPDPSVFSSQSRPPTFLMSSCFRNVFIRCLIDCKCLLINVLASTSSSQFSGFVV